MAGTAGCIVVAAAGVAAADARRAAVEHRAAVAGELTAVARTFASDLGQLPVADPSGVQAHLARLQELHRLEKVSAYRLEPGGAVRRIASTEPGAVGELLPAGSGDAAALRAGAPVYEEERSGGRHLAEVVHAIPTADGAPALGVGFYQDLAAADAALAARQRRSMAITALAALAAAAALALLLRRLVVTPLRQLQAGMHAVRGGALHARLGWARRDELGALARDFDEMAAELERSHARLSSLALEDELTRLPNRRAALARLAAELAAARRERSSLAVVLLDVDHFKAINDRWGHGVGDAALRALAQAAALGLRPGDLAARLGGDEFLLLLRGADAAEAADVVYRLSEVISCLQVAPDGSTFTISAGIASHPPDLPHDAGDEQDLLERADQALYRAKTGGRAQAATC